MLAGILFLGGCGPLKLPDLPEPIDTPPTEVRAVRMIESSGEAGRYQIVVHLRNPNDLPLPIAHAGYQLRVGERVSDDNFIPPATVPAKGQMTIELPTALPDGAPDGSYEVSGSMSFRPEGEIRRVLYQLGVPLPSVPFEGSGTVQVVSGAAPEPASAERTDAEEAPDADAAEPETGNESPENGSGEPQATEGSGSDGG
jgi:hypothetical protein